MPCMSYDSNWANSSSDSDVKRIKKEADMLARIACKALQELEDNGIADMLLLKDDEAREWWAKHKEADRKAREKREARERRERVKKEALAKLSQEERDVLGIGKKSKKEAYVDIEALEEIMTDEYSSVYASPGVRIYMDKRGDIHVTEEDENDPF